MPEISMPVKWRQEEAQNSRFRQPNLIQKFQFQVPVRYLDSKQRKRLLNSNRPSSLHMHANTTVPLHVDGHPYEERDTTKFTVGDHAKKGIELAFYYTQKQISCPLTKNAASFAFRKAFDFLHADACFCLYVFL